MFKNTYEKFKDMNFGQKIIIGILTTVGAAIIIGLFVMATKVYSFEVDITDIKGDMKEKASKEYVDKSLEKVDVVVGTNGDNIKAIKEQDIKEIKDGIKELNEKYDDNTQQLNNKIDQNQRFLIEYIDKKMK